MKRKILIGMLGMALLLLTVGVTYSYFTGIITGEGKKLKVAATELRILFTDSSSLSDNEIEPGWSQTKTFSVKNESDDNFNYNIVFENLVNTFVTEGFLQYKITSTNGYNMTGYLDIPKSSTPTDVVLAYDIDIPVDTTHEYTIEFVYHDSTTVDQSEDMGKVLNGNLAIVEGTVNPSIKYTVTMNSDNGVITPTSGETVKKGNLEFSVTPNTGYDVNTMSLSCDPVANTVIAGNKIKVNDIRQDHNCEVSFDKETYRVNIVVNNGKSDALNKVVEYGGSGTATITPNYGYTLVGATVSGTGCSIEGDILTISNVQGDGTCEVTLPREKYTVTLNGEHILSDSPKTVEYEGNTTFNVSPEEGYTLGTSVSCDNIEVEASIDSGVVTVNNVTSNTTCSIGSTIKSYRVNIDVTNGSSDFGYKDITHGSDVEFNITPSTGYTMTGASISNGCSIEGNKVKVSNVKSNITCTLSLVKERYTVTLSGSNVTITGSPSSALYKEETTFTVSANEGYTLGTTVSCDNGSGSISGNTVTISNVVGNTTCTISPKQLKYNVTLNVVNGTGSETKEVNHGSSTTFNITANTNYTLDNPDVSCTGGTYTSGKLEVKNVTSNITCTVTLKLVKHKVNIIVSGGNSNPPSKDIEHGGRDTFEITAIANYNLSRASVTSGNCTLGNVSNNKRILTASNVTGTRSCTVTIPLVTYTATVNVTGGTAKYGSTTALSKVTASINHGSSPKFTIAASTNYNLSGASVTGTGCSLSSDKSTLTISNMTGARTCNVTIPKKTYTVSVSVNDSAMGSVSPASSTVNHGDDLEVTITPNSGYKYSSNTCGLEVTNNKMTFTNITSNNNCSVTFTQITYTVNVSSNNSNYGTVSVSSSTVNHGDTVQITLSPKNGYVYSSNTCGAEPLKNIITLSNITETLNCEVTFEEIPLVCENPDLDTCKIYNVQMNGADQECKEQCKLFYSATNYYSVYNCKSNGFCYCCCTNEC